METRINKALTAFSVPDFAHSIRARGVGLKVSGRCLVSHTPDRGGIGPEKGATNE